MEGLYEQKQKAFATAARHIPKITTGFVQSVTTLLQVLASASIPAPMPAQLHASSSSSSLPAQRFARGAGGAGGAGGGGGPDAWNEFMERVRLCCASHLTPHTSHLSRQVLEPPRWAEPSSLKHGANTGGSARIKSSVAALLQVARIVPANI